MLPSNARSQLRKSLALLDEPEASYQHFSALINSFSSKKIAKNKERLLIIRQMAICLWILFAWAREAGNLESAYQSAELTLLHAWQITKNHIAKKTKDARDIQSTFITILNTCYQINKEYLNKCIIPYANKLHVMSSAIQSSCQLDVNFKLFDILGRLAIGGIWDYWLAQNLIEQDPKA